nr:putative reverse transcriptase domain-containing protein [Tanacetum cinerariifolium]
MDHVRATVAYQGVPTCFECGAQGHYKRNCPRLGNKNQGNQDQAGNGNAMARAYGLGTEGGNPNANVVTGTFLLNDHCASILFDTGADKSFVSTTFSSLININPSTLDYSYDVELADGQIIGVNTVIRGCTLNLLNHPFNIDLMPVELDSFDVIVGMDWLKTYHAVIVCDEKIVRVPFEDETLIIRCDGSNNGNQLNLISCIKTRKYLLKGYPVFLANITTKTIKDKSKEKQLEDVPIVRDFSEVFPEDLPESDEIERYVGGLPEMIRGNVMSYEPKSMQKAIESTNEQMDQKLIGIADRQADNKREFDNNSRNQQNQQPFRRNNNVAQAYAAGSGEKPYRGTKPLCPKCNFYHEGPCRPKCTNCKRAGHIARDWSLQEKLPEVGKQESGESRSGWEWKCGGKSIWTRYCRRKPKRQCRDG